MYLATFHQWPLVTQAHALSGAYCMISAFEDVSSALCPPVCSRWEQTCLSGAAFSNQFGLCPSQIKVPSFSETLSALNVVQVAGGSKSLFAGVWYIFVILFFFWSECSFIQWYALMLNLPCCPCCSDGRGEDLRMWRGHKRQVRPGPVQRHHPNPPSDHCPQ